MSSHDVAPGAATPTTPQHEAVEIRRATILDVPAIVRALPLPQAPEGMSESDLTRILRLALTHLAIEHGEAWVALSEDGDVMASALAVPTWELGDGAELPELLSREIEIGPDAPDSGSGQLDWLADLGKVWLIAHPVSGADWLAVRLLDAVVTSVAGSARRDGVPLAILAADDADRRAAKDLGFVARDIPALTPGAWVGVRLASPAHTG